MITFDTLERFFAGDFETSECPRERDYYALWQARDLNLRPPMDAALEGALLADRLAWVFTAGYQATLRNAFPMLPADGWAAFAATEDHHDPQAHPGTTLDEAGDNYRLNGHKSWVAHSRCVDHLIITINHPSGDKYLARGLIVPSNARGVVLTHRESPGFLAAMSQGYAAFSDVDIARASVFEFEPVRLFGRTEAKFVMLAAAAFMLAKTSEGSLRDQLVTVIGGLMTLLCEQSTSRQVYAAIERSFQACVTSFEATCPVDKIPDYAADRRLLKMYSAKIQRRGGYARAEVAKSRQHETS